MQVVYLFAAIITLISAFWGAYEAIKDRKDLERLDKVIIWTILVSAIMTGGYALGAVVSALN